MSQPGFIPLKPIPIKDRVSMIFVYYGRIDVKDGAFVVSVPHMRGDEPFKGIKDKGERQKAVFPTGVGMN